MEGICIEFKSINTMWIGFRNDVLFSAENISDFLHGCINNYYHGLKDDHWY